MRGFAGHRLDLLIWRPIDDSYRVWFGFVIPIADLSVHLEVAVGSARFAKRDFHHPHSTLLVDDLGFFAVRAL
jgi:hypothetical protein